MAPRARKRVPVWLAVLSMLAATLVAAVTAAAPAAAAGSTRNIPSGGTTNLAAAAAALGHPTLRLEHEFPAAGEGADDEEGGPPDTPAVPPRANGSDVSRQTPGIRTSFEGLSMFDQRFANNGNQFSVEPPDQGLCVGNGFVLESTNDVLRVFGTDGTPKTGVVDLNTFYGYAPQFDRTTGLQGPFVTDPSCIFDQATQRFYHVVLTLEVNPATGDFLGPNHLDLAVSRTADPTGDWAIYRLPVQDDGTDGTPDHGCAPGPGSELSTNPNACIGDFPHIGADANGVFLTSNEYDFFGPDFQGAQVYALSKRALARADATVAVTQFDTSAGSGNELGDEPGFTVWPATSPGTNQFATGNGGTEFFLSSNAAEEAKGEEAGASNELGVWALTNTRSLDAATPDVTLRNGTERVRRYTVPPTADQKAGPFPLGECINDTVIPTQFGPGCWQLFFTPDAEPAHDEVISHPDGSDSRMNQVVYSGGTLMGSVGTGVRVRHEEKVGAEWFIATPQLRRGKVGAKVRSGYVAVDGNNLTYPTMAALPNGRGVMSFTLLGEDHFPSIAYSRIANNDVEDTVRVVGVGAAPDDGFTSYKALVGDPPRTRWGDYGAAAVDGNDIWFAGEFIAHSCTLTQFVADLTCGSTRAPLGNWSTNVSRFRP
jgi:hypothetical protein